MICIVTLLLVCLACVGHGFRPSVANLHASNTAKFKLPVRVPSTPSNSVSPQFWNHRATRAPHPSRSQIAMRDDYSKYEDTVDGLMVDIPQILNKEPDWGVFDEYVELADDTGFKLEGLKRIKLFATILRKMQRKRVASKTIWVEDDLQIDTKSIFSTPYLVARGKVKFNAARKLFFWRTGLPIEIEVEVRFHLNDKSQIYRIQVEKLRARAVTRNSGKNAIMELASLPLNGNLKHDWKSVKTWIRELSERAKSHKNKGKDRKIINVAGNKKVPRGEPRESQEEWLATRDAFLKNWEARRSSPGRRKVDRIKQALREGKTAADFDDDEFDVQRFRRKESAASAAPAASAASADEGIGHPRFRNLDNFDWRIQDSDDDDDIMVPEILADDWKLVDTFNEKPKKTITKKDVEDLRRLFDEGGFK